MIEPDESLLALLEKSNSEVLEGRTITMDEVDLFMKNKVNELTNSCIGTSCLHFPLIG